MRPAQPGNRFPGRSQHLLATFQQLLGRSLGLEAQIDQLGRRQPELLEQDRRVADRRLEVRAAFEFDFDKPLQLTVDARDQGVQLALLGPGQPAEQEINSLVPCLDDEVARLDQSGDRRLGQVLDRVAHQMPLLETHRP
jgi:hypothetical protein